MVDKLRQIVEWQVLELIKKMSEFGKMTNEQAQQIAKRTIELLKPGMVVSVEPGVYIEGKFGIRIEDLVLLTKSGPEILSKSPKDLTK